jgi:hypothetical protein
MYVEVLAPLASEIAKPLVNASPNIQLPFLILQFCDHHDSLHLEQVSSLLGLLLHMGTQLYTSWHQNASRLRNEWMIVIIMVEFT